MSKLKPNTISIELQIDQDNEVMDVEVEYNLSVTMSEDQKSFYVNVVNGLNSKLKSEIDTFAKEGFFIKEISQLRALADHMVSVEPYDDEDDSEYTIDFEPDDELVEAVSEKKNGHKIIKFNGKKVH
jgi:hypothetical protein